MELVVLPRIPGVKRLMLSRFAPYATANCSMLREKCRVPQAHLFFRLRISLLSCSRVLKRLN